jgi:hypothetical protein
VNLPNGRMSGYKSTNSRIVGYPRSGSPPTICAPGMAF